MTGPDVSERCHCKASKPATTKPTVVPWDTHVNYEAIRCDIRSRTCPQQYHVTVTTIFTPARTTPTARRIDSLVQDHRRSIRGRIQNRIDHLCERSTVVGLRYGHNFHTSTDTSPTTVTTHMNWTRVHMSARLLIIESAQGKNDPGDPVPITEPPGSFAHLHKQAREACFSKSSTMIHHNTTCTQRSLPRMTWISFIPGRRTSRYQMAAKNKTRSVERQETLKRTVRRTLQPQRNLKSQHVAQRRWAPYDHETHIAEIPLVLHLYR